MDWSRRGNMLKMYLSRLKQIQGTTMEDDRKGTKSAGGKKTLQTGFPWGSKHKINLGPSSS